MTTLEKEKIKRVLIGEVVSDKMEKTVVVKTVRIILHPKFHKVLKKINNSLHFTGCIVLKLF